MTRNHPFEGPEVFDDTPTTTMTIEEIWPNTSAAVAALRAGRRAAAEEALRNGEILWPPAPGCGHGG